METIPSHFQVAAHKGEIIITMVRGSSFVADAYSVEHAESIAKGLLAQIEVARQQLKADEDDE